MTLLSKVKRAIRGDIAAKAVVLEVLRRGHASIRQSRERANLKRRAKDAARLRPEFARMEAAGLLNHFQRRTEPVFLPGFAESPASFRILQQNHFPKETAELVGAAQRIVNDQCWPLLGLGDKIFGAQINWHRDPLSGAIWPRDYHADINLIRGDGSDVRALWELNRLPHLITLACAYRMTNDERLSTEFFQQVENWRSQNPYGRGANWNCAMEVALRAMNLLGAFELFRHSQHLDADTLTGMLTMFTQHGKFIRSNLEFSYVATSNHYLSDLAGLVWLGVMLPELEEAREWREFGLRQMLQEMDKQVLPDGADFEASTGYHRFVLELFLYTFILCRANAIEVKDGHWRKLQDMLEYVRAYLRPDGRAPLVGDSDGGQVFPICRRCGDDHAYLLAIGAVVFENARFKVPDLAMPEVLPWILGEDGVNAYKKLIANETLTNSRAFPEAGTYILRDRDLYLLFNASGAGLNGRGSHGHNDALSLEVSACGRAFIVDPGSYVYTADLQERHRFRSTSYHSTVEIDNLDQNTTNENVPFVIGDEARPRVIVWETKADFDRVVAEHHGYKRLAQPVTHRRAVTFDKQKRWWLVEDEFLGAGKHDFVTRFHFDTGLTVSIYDGASALAHDETSGSRLLVCPLDLQQSPVFESQFTSREYASKAPSLSACWLMTASMPFKVRWAIVPVSSAENEDERLKLIESMKAQVSSQ